jgi:hypothetical protein
MMSESFDLNHREQRDASSSERLTSMHAIAMDEASDVYLARESLMPGYDSNNVFAKILRGELPSQKVYEDADTVAIMDIMPRCQGPARRSSPPA